MKSVSRNITTASGSQNKFSDFMASATAKRMITETVGKKSDQFTTAIVAAVSQNPQIGNCKHFTILSAALQGAALDLSPSPTLGHFYMVPYKDSAVFQLGYRGYIQLAIRSGQYRKINVLDIREGELLGWNPMSEQISVDIIENDEVRSKLPVIGYYAMFELTNGFQKSMYWSKEKMVAHAQTYSKAYNRDDSFWKKDFDVMAYKTMLRQLLSKWGVLSIEMQTAIDKDMSVIDGHAVTYVDNDLIDVSGSAPAPVIEIPQQQQDDPVSAFFS